MFYTYENIDIHYEIIGDGKPILMFHGFGCSLELMKGCMEPKFLISRRIIWRLFSKRYIIKAS